MQSIRAAGSRLLGGGLKGYEQLQAMAQGLAPLEDAHPDAAYLLLLKKRVELVLAKNRTAAEDLKKAHQLLRQVAGCLHYPSTAVQDPRPPVNRQQVAHQIERLIQETHPDGKVQRAQVRLLNGVQKRWALYGCELLYCYEIPGLPQDNLKLESIFGRLRRHQRRISGRKSTRELLDFGQAQILFTAASLPELLSQIQVIPPELYQRYRQRLAEAERPRQFFRRLHHDPLATVQALVSQHRFRSFVIQDQKETLAQSEQTLHTG